MNSGFDIWLQVALAAALVLAGIAALVAKRRAARHNARLRDTVHAAESIRLLGLAYQGEGKLDMAWQKFLEAPESNLLLDDMYNLALDFEKAGQPKMVMTVLRHVQERKPGYRDLERILEKARQRAVLARAAVAKPQAPAKPQAAAKPRFGSFEVEGELGKGAMGVVYRGADTVLGREVAIKTLPLAQEFEGEALEEARTLFFREVRLAGALSHENIVTIYDAGEERGACYIAMELLKSGDVAAFAAPGNLLPAEKAVDIASRVAEALGYAHREGVVHYDVRPGNILYHPESDTVKLTDFGIARLTAKSKTKSGVSLGTPAYMSPEQLRGAPVDGRSDLYSLGVTLRQMLTGKLPSAGEASDVEVPAALAAVLGRALAEKPEERFQTGEEFSGALQAALAQKAGAESAAVDISL